MKAKNEGHALTDSVRSVDVSERLNVTKASVNKALSALKDGGFVDQTRYGRVELTEEGKTYAAEVWGRHRMLRFFLTVELGVDEEVADEEACLMEHALSQDTSRRLYDYLKRQGVAMEQE